MRAGNLISSIGSAEWLLCHHPHIRTPAVERRRRGARIEHDARFAPACAHTRVPAIVQKHIGDTDTDLARALEVAGVVALREDAPLPPELAVQRSRDSDRQSP